MKIVLVLVVVIIILVSYMVLSGRKQIRELEEAQKLLTLKNYELIRDSPYADELSKHSIQREENKLIFSSKNGYTLFWLEINEKESNGVKLRGLDGYGIRDREFLKYSANLIRKITHVE